MGSDGKEKNRESFPAPPHHSPRPRPAFRFILRAATGDEAGLGVHAACKLHCKLLYCKCRTTSHKLVWDVLHALNNINFVKKVDPSLVVSLRSLIEIVVTFLIKCVP